MGIFSDKKLTAVLSDKYDLEERDIIALVKKPPYGGVCLNDKIYKATVPLVACIDTKTNELIKTPAYLRWAYFKGKSCNRFKVKSLGVYKLRVRFSLPDDSKTGFPSMLVTKMLKRNCKETRLDEIKEEYKKPVYLEIKDGERLLLNREYDWFEGNIIWRSNEVGLTVSVPSGENTPSESSLVTLDAIMSDPEKWERDAKLYAAKEMTESANDWQEGQDDYIPITVADFAKRITLASIIVEDDDYQIYFDDDNMFWGHVIVVCGNSEMGFNETNIMG